MFANAVNLPLNLGLAGFNSGMAVATAGISQLSRQVLSFGALSAKGLAPVVVGAGAVSKSIVGAFSANNLLKIRAINDAIQQFGATAILSAANLQKFGVLAPVAAVLNPTFGQLAVTASGLDAVLVTLVGRSIVGFKNLGANAKVNVAGLAVGAFLALSATIPLVATQARLINQVFITGLIPNIQTLNALVNARKSFFKGNLLKPVRYTDWVVLAGIIKNLLPASSLLGQTLNSLAVPIKFNRNLQQARALFTLMRQEVAFLVGEINGLSTGLAQSAGSLLQGGGFLLPGQLPTGPTVFDMFDKQQAVEQAVNFEQLTRNFEAISKWSGATESAIGGVKRELLQLTGATGQSLDATAAMADILQKSNQPIEESTNQLRSFAFAATATNSDVKTLGMTVLDVLDSFSLGADQTGRVTDMLTAVSLTTGSSVQDLGTSLKVSGSTAQRANQSLESTLAIIGLLTSAGLDASQSGNALNGFLTNLQIASSDMSKADFTSAKADTKGKALAAIGLSKEDISTAQGELKPLIDILPILQAKITAFKATAGAGATNTVLNAVFGMEGTKIVNGLLSQTSTQLDTLTATISNSSGVAQKITSSQMGGLVGTLEKLNSAAIGISTTLGLMLAPVLNTLISPLANLADGFLKLPSAIQAVAFSLSVLVPVSLFYFQATKTVLYFNKAVAVSKVALGVAIDIYTGKLAFSTIVTNISNEATKIKLFFTNALSFATNVLTGKISMQAAQQIILNNITKFGNANYKEYIGTTLQAGQIFLKHLATLGLMILAWQALSELFKQSPGAKIAGDIDKATQELSKLRGELEWHKTAPEIITDLQISFTNFADNLQSKGFAEAMRIQLTLIQDAVADTKSAVDTYGQGWIITGEQLGNQKSMFALERQLQTVNTVLDGGINIMQKYGVETLDAGDKQRLGATGIASFKTAAEEQIKTLNASVEAMRKQAPATEEQKQLQQANIKLAENQINALRNKVQALESDSFAEDINNKTIKAKILTLEEVTKKYQALASAQELSSLKSSASIEEMVAKGEGRGGINQKDASAQQRGLQQLDITERVRANKAKAKDLKAASIGAAPEDAVKIAEELAKIEADQVKARIDRAKLEQQARKELNEEILANTKEREEFIASAQELSAQKQINAIKQSQITGSKSAEEAAEAISKIESAGIQSQIDRETDKQKKLKQLRQWGVVSAEEQRKGLRDSAATIEKNKTQLLDNKIKQIAEQTARQVKAIEDAAKLSAAKKLTSLDASSFAIDQQSKVQQAQFGVAGAKDASEKQRLDFAQQLAELNGNSAQAEQIKAQIYQQQLAALDRQQAAKLQELAISQQQQAIDLQRKQVQAEIAVVEAQSALDAAKAKGASTSELAELQQSLAAKKQAISQVAVEKTNQEKLNSLASEQLKIEQQSSKEGLQQQRQIELQRQEIEKRTKAIEEGLQRARSAAEAKSQKLEFKGQDVGAEVEKQKLLADISQSQANLQKQRLEFGLLQAELSGNEASKEQIKTQIYQQQKSALVAQQQAQIVSAKLSREQAAIELERKRISAEIALVEARANLESAKAKNASVSELQSLQAVISLRQSAIGQISKEEANQQKINQLTDQHLSLEQQIAREGLEQQRQLDLQKQAIENRTKAIEDGLIRTRTALESQSQSLEFKGQNLGGEIEKQKGTSDLAQAQANYQKQQLDFALQRAELSGSEAQKEQIKEQIYQQQKSALQAQHQAQVAGIKLSREQAAIELTRQKLLAQIAVSEAQANLEKAKVQKNVSAAEIQSLQAVVGYRQQALSQIDRAAATQRQVQGIEDKKLQIENLTTLENLKQTRELELQREAIEKQKTAIEQRLESQKAGLENRQGKLELSNQLLDLESRQLSARSGLTEATNGLEQQRLEFLISQAEIVGDTAGKEQLKAQLYNQQLAALERSQIAQQQSFEISQKQKQIELDKQEIQAKIATFEAEANIAKAKTDKASAQQISALEAVYKLRQEALGQLAQIRAAEGQIAGLERQKLRVEQLSAREKLIQTDRLEKMRQAHEANNRAIEKGNQLEKEKSQAQSIDTSGGITWIDKAAPAWFEGAKTSFQKTAKEYFAASLPPKESIAPVADLGSGVKSPGVQKTPDTPQQLVDMQVSARNVYLNGSVASQSKPADWLQDAIANVGASPIGNSKEAAAAQVDRARSELSAAIARHNAEARSLTVDPAEAARQGLKASADAKAYVAQIREDLRTGVLKNQVSGTISPINLPPTIFELQDNLIKAEAAFKEIKANTPATITDIYKSIMEIKDLLKNLHTGNLTVVSQNPVAECGEILNALTRRR